MNLSLFNFVHQFVGQYIWLDWLGIFCAQYLAYEIVALLLIYAYRERKYLINILVLPILSAGIARGIFVTIIRHFYHHPRPFVTLNFIPLISDTAWSFPSGHTTFFFALAASVYFYNKKLGTCFLILTILVGLGRVYTGIHWPYDILGGAILGLATSWTVEQLHRKYKSKIGF